MVHTGKLVIFVGLAMMVIGGIIWLVGKAGFRGMPGDIHYQSPRVSIYFPIITCLVLSALLTLGLWLWQWISRR